MQSGKAFQWLNKKNKKYFSKPVVYYNYTFYIRFSFNQSTK